MLEMLVATTNAGKLPELRRALEGLGVVLLSLGDVEPMEAPEETGATFEENALLKARYYSRKSGRLTLADDSGLEIAAWGGAPGVHSARFLGKGTPYAERNRIIVERLGAEEDRRARFVCVIAVSAPSGQELVVEGAAEGRIGREPQGTGGFGYDPIFEVAGLGRTFAELRAEEKAAVGHRGRALEKLRRELPAFLAGLESELGVQRPELREEGTFG